jgi:prepilin-type processing-associated H-X9-DG protein
MLAYDGQPPGYVTDIEIRSMFRVGNGYQPRLDRVGTPSRKVWAMDGARYYHPVNGVSFNDLPYQNDGGNFMITGPVYPRSGDPFLIDRLDLTNPRSWTLTEVALRLAYRHNKRINVVFMDGHCETLNLLKSLKPTYYFPKGTYITTLGAAALQSPDTGPGYIR